MWFLPFLFVGLSCAARDVTPEQIHLSYHGEPDEMVVTWITWKKVKDDSFVIYGKSADKLEHKELASNYHKYTSHGDLGLERHVYTAKLKNLHPRTVYFYRVGSEERMSNVFNFKSMSTDKTDYKVAVFGDLGVANGVSTESLINRAQDGEFDLVIHIGDFAYNLHTNNGILGDQFFAQILPIAAFVPYMTVAGNHEHKHDFHEYKHRFAMTKNGVGVTDNQFYSFDLGEVHFIALSSEYYGFAMTDDVETQFEWLKTDLETTRKPWIVTYMHRPMYCSAKGSQDCTTADSEYIRLGNATIPGLEQIFNDKGVDFGFWGHKHYYERLFPVYNNKTYPQTLNVYKNAQTPVYVITGAAGNRDNHTFVSDFIPTYSAVRSPEYGYMVMHVHNSTHIHLKQLSVEQQDTVVDDLWVIKDAGYRPGVKTVDPAEPMRFNRVEMEQLIKTNEGSDSEL